MDIPPINGFGHVDLTVTDGERSARWWEQVLGFQQVHATDNTTHNFQVRSMFHPSFVSVNLVTHEERETDTFNERVVGLDHLALRVPDRDALEAWAKHLDAMGVEHSGIKEENGGPLIVFRDPDNIQLELWAFNWDLVQLDQDS